MTSQARTDATPVTFTLKEGPRGESRVMIEENEPGLPVLRDGDAFLMIQFRKGVTLKQAEDFVGQMSKMLDVLTYTKFTS